MDAAVFVAALPPELPIWRRVTDLAGLVEIFDPAVQICTWRREIDLDATAYLEGLERTGTLQALETVSAADQPRLASLPANPGRAALIDDLSLLLELVCELLGCSAVGLRLARLGHGMCPGWHVDHVGIRLICTYQGPATEWLDDQGVDRRNLGIGRIGDGVFVEAAPGEVVLLKGARWQDNEQLGAIHRSPGIAPGSGLRTLVTLDPLWRA